MARSRLFLALIPLAVTACADDGKDGTAGESSLIVTSDAGDECESGGLKVDTGLDTNGDGTLAADEITATSYICNGAAGANGVDGVDGVGAEDIQSSTSPATAEQCPEGGQVIQFERADGTATGEPVVLCGASVSGAFGAAPFSRVSRSENSRNDTPVVAREGEAGAQVLSASITVPTSGVIIATASASAYCGTVSDPLYGLCSPTTGNTVAFLTVLPSTAPSQAGNAGDYNALAGIPEDRESEISVTSATTVGAAGTYTFNLVAKAEEFSPTATQASVSFSTAQLVLFFLPTAS